MDNKRKKWNIMERPGVLKKCCQLEAVVQKIFQSSKAWENGLIRMVSLDGIWYYHRETGIFIPLTQNYLEESYTSDAKPVKGYIRMKSVSIAWDYLNDTEAEEILPKLAGLELSSASGKGSLSEVCRTGIVLLRDGGVYDGKSGKIRLPQSNEMGKALQICHVEDAHERRESKSWYYDIYIWAKTGIIPAVLCNITDCWNTMLYLRDNFKDMDFTDFLLQGIEREKVEQPTANTKPAEAAVEAGVNSKTEPKVKQESSVKSELKAAEEQDKGIKQEAGSSVRPSQALEQGEESEKKPEAAIAAEAEKKPEEAAEAEKEPEEAISAAAEAEKEPEETSAAEAEKEPEEAISAAAETEKEPEEAAEAEKEPEEAISAAAETEKEPEEAAEAEKEPEEAPVAETEKEPEEAIAAEAKKEPEEAIAAEIEKEPEETPAAEAEKEPEEAISAAAEAEKEPEETSAAEAEKEPEEAISAAAETEKEPEEAISAAAEAKKEPEEAIAAEAEKDPEEEAIAAEAEKDPEEAIAAEAKKEPEEAIAAEAEKEPEEAIAAEAEKEPEEAITAAAEAEKEPEEAITAAAEAEEDPEEAENMKKEEGTAESYAEFKPEPEIVKKTEAATEKMEVLSGQEESGSLVEDEVSLESGSIGEQKELDGTEHFDSQVQEEKTEEFGRIEKMNNVRGEEEIQELLDCDKNRCRLEAYDRDILYDIIRGHWELFESGDNITDSNEEGLIARDPKLDIRSGVIGIDFGTKSTVVVRQDETNRIIPIRIGTGNLSSEVKEEDFENPSIVEFTNVKKFLEDYEKEIGRPHTSCNDIFVSYDAYEDFRNCNPDDFYAYFSELKQWANREKGNVIIKDKQRMEYTLGRKADETARVVNPIELYAYYIGLYINNMRNGIYLKYLMTFPVGYAKEIRDFIADSFYEGIKKSLPASIINDEECMKQFKVELGVSEPAAYAVTALEQSGLEPKDETDHRMYGIFDFGGGTTDFDFGICRGTTEEEYEKEAYDYVLECFGADSDVTLGGENILELMAYQVYQSNLEMFREKKITFMLPLGENGFAGSETLLLNSQIARRNMAILKEELRPLWHQTQGWRKKYQLEDDSQKETDKEGIVVSLYNMDGEPIPQCVLEFSSQELVEVLKNRIQKGIDSFFQCLIKIFMDRKELKKEENTIYIFLAGNSSKSVFVKELFQKKIEEYYSRTKKLEEGMANVRFELIEPLTGESESGDKYVPNAKTGVAYGLLKSREGSSIKIVKNYETDSQQQSRFRYYLGRDHRHYFDCRFSPVEIAYKKWMPFQGASKNVVRIYYTNNPMADSKMEQMRIDDVPYKEVTIDVKEDAFLYIRTVEPDVVEYVVAKDVQEISENEIKKCCFG